LVQTLLSERFTVGRLAGQSAWQRCVPDDSVPASSRPRCQQTPQPGTKRFAQLEKAARAARARLAADSSAASLHVSALLDLRWREVASAGLDRAIALLERARRSDPENAAILNDLAVAYLELGEREQQLQPTLQALDLVERSLSRDSALASALFNRALIRERLYLVASARQHWRSYLAVHSNSGWSLEASERVQRLDTNAEPPYWNELLTPELTWRAGLSQTDITKRVQYSPTAAREFAFRTLFREWGLAHRQGQNARAATLLTMARQVARSFETLNADLSLSFAVQSIDRLAADPERLNDLASAYIDTGDGMTLYLRGSYDDALAPLARAERMLRLLGSRVAGWAAFYRGATSVNRGDYAIGDSLFQRIASEATKQQPALAGKVIWALGVSQLRRANFERATDYYRSAAPYFTLAKEPENAHAVVFLLAESLGFAGQAYAGSMEAYRGLRLLHGYRRSVWLNHHLNTVATYARAGGLHHAALAVMQEALTVVPGLDNPVDKTRAFLFTSGDLLAIGDSIAARAHLSEATRWIDSIAPGHARDRNRADVRLAIGKLQRKVDPAGAFQSLTDVASEYHRLKIEFDVPVALYHAGLAAEAAGDRTSARLRLQEAVAYIERHQSFYTTAELRASGLELVENVYDALVDVELDDQRPAAAFAYLERSRLAAWPARERRLGISAVEPSVSLARVAAALPSDMLFVEYALLPDQIVIWTASRRGSKQRVVNASRDSVSALVRQFHQESRIAKEEAAQSRARLFDLLIRPFEADLQGIKQLTIVPDRELHQLPFSALWDRRLKQYLLEGYVIRSAPSAAFFRAASMRTRVRHVGAALVVGDPEIRNAAAPGLSRLPGAIQEARAIQPFYPNSTLLTGANANRKRVLQLLPAHPVFHFAGHAVFNNEQPELSYLALASNGSDDQGLLLAREIGSLRLSNLEVVVLSACSTSSPRSSRGGAVSGLAYSFLRAGAPATVSTLWDVDDAAAMEVLIAFHRAYAGRVPAAEALRRAQLNARDSTRPELRAPHAWAAFVYAGP
jgi:CHAT domain-containing protein